jgi:hypothetical protein
MVMLRAFWDAASHLDPERGSALDEANSMAFCREGQLAELWEQSGLESITSGQLVVGADYANFDDFWQPFLTGVGPSGAYCKSLDPVRQEALRSECWQRLGKPAGRFHLTARAWSVVGIKLGAGQLDRS